MEKKADQRPVCKFFLQGFCKHHNKCHNSHHLSQNKKICFDFRETGYCKYGSKCYFAHIVKNPLSKPKESLEKNDPNNDPQLKIQNNINSNDGSIRNNDLKNEKANVNGKNREIQEKKVEGSENQNQDEKNDGKKDIFKHRSFIDFSKTKLGQEILEKNKDLWGPEITFFEYLKTLKKEKDIELCQIQRKYKSSFMWISDFNQENETKAFQIRYSPTIKRDQIELDFEIEEGYFWLEFIIHWNLYPENNSFQINLINNSIPHFFKKAFSSYFKKIFEETKSVFKTLRNIDNSLDKICQELTKKKSKHVEDTWTQQQQSALEKAIVTYRSITNSVEKWNAIANDVPDKDTDACIKRFKECREKAIAAKKEKKKEESESEEEESSENEEESSENEEISEENEIGNEPEEDESEEEEEKKEFEKTKEKSLESDYNVYLNLVIKVNDLKMKQVGVINLEEVIVLVKCQKCKDEVDKRLTLHKEFTDYLYNDVLCANCNTSGIILLKKSFLHGGSNIFGRMGSNSWDILDVFTVNVNAVCEMCNHGQVFEKYVVGTSINFNCHSCFKENGFSFSSYSLTFEEYAEIFKKKPQNTSKAPNNEESKKMKTKKIGNFKLDQALPANGSCKHYKHSYRYFRFPCCGKCDPCDDCHFEKEKHEMILAKNMICGFCSYEQTIKDQCMRCGKLLTKKTSLGGKHWEGGKGCRNQQFMSKKDSHKFSGINKTIPKKATKK